MKRVVFGAVFAIVLSVVIVFGVNAKKADDGLGEELIEMMNTEEEYVWQSDGTTFPDELPDRPTLYFTFLNKCDPTDMGGLRPYVYLQYAKEERTLTVFVEEMGCHAYDGIGYYRWNGSIYGEILLPFDLLKDATSENISDMISQIEAKYPQLSGYERV